MSKSFALDPLNMQAAIFAEAMLVVRARVLEAAFIMAHLPATGIFPAKLKSRWPAYQQDTFGGHDPAYGRGAKRQTYHPDAKALSRAEEVLTVFLPHLKCDDERRLLSRWAACLAAPRQAGSFSQYCKANGLVKRTAERHLNTIIMTLTEEIMKEKAEIICPDWRRILGLLPKSFTNAEPLRHLTYWRADNAVPQNLPQWRIASQQHSPLS